MIVPSAARADDAVCIACHGGNVPCYGGGNPDCHRRSKVAQRLALILDGYGGVRTVVGTRASIAANTRNDDFAFVVPRLMLREPIAWNDVPIVIARARLEFETWLERRPNLTEAQHRAVVLYRLRQLRQNGTIDLGSIVET